MPPKRPSISGVFPGVDMPQPVSSESREPSPTRQKGLRATLRQTFTQRWPKWTSTRSSKRLNFTIRMNGLYREMGDALEHFDEAQRDMNHIIISHQQNAQIFGPQIYTWVEESMIEAIFGSNAIERAGSSYKVTLDICRRIFHGLPVEAAVEARSPEYEEGLRQLKADNLLQAGQKEAVLVLRSRLEVINHAKALEHLVNALVYEDMLLSEELICETHAILCQGIETKDGTPSSEYGGKYRSDHVWVAQKNRKKPFRFVHHSAIPSFMSNMCAQYQSDITEIERTKDVDPFALAARYSHVFVNVHPFSDGNGRMCRLILNAILLKYAGVCVPIGEEGDDSRQAYLDIMARSNYNFLTEDADDFKATGHEDLATLVVKKANGRFKQAIKDFISPVSLAHHSH